MITNLAAPAGVYSRCRGGGVRCGSAVRRITTT